MKNVRLYMIFQWVVFLPVILPMCIIFGALYGVVQMVERIIDQIRVDIMPSEQNQLLH